MTEARTTSLALEPAAGRARLHHRMGGDATRPGLRPMLLDVTEWSARVCLVPDGAMLLAGDDVVLDVAVGAGMHLDLVEAAGTVAYDTRGGSPARSTVRICLERSATLTWRAEPLVIATGADVVRRVEVVLGPDARLVLGEAIVLGRHGETGGRLLQETRVMAATGAPLLVEDLRVEEAAGVPGLLGTSRAITSVLALGLHPTAAGSAGVPATGRSALTRFELDDGGSLWRGLGEALHQVPYDDVWDAATSTLDVRRRPAATCG